MVILVDGEGNTLALLWSVLMPVYRFIILYGVLLNE